ncbi:MAG: aspartate/glutamate racemase family protein [Sulfitobacter sp.]
MTVLLMNPNSNLGTTKMMCRIAAEVLEVPPRPWTVPEGPALITTNRALVAAGRLIEHAEIPKDIEAIIVSAFGDPGAAALAARLHIPVVGIGGAAARASLLPFAVATTTPALVGSIDKLMRSNATQTTYCGCFITEGDPNELMENEQSLDQALLAAVHAAARAGAHRVIIGGGPLGEAAERLSSRSPLPLTSPIRAAAKEVRALLG